MRVSKKKPIPKSRRTVRNPIKWRFDLLKDIGDSILVSGDSKVLSKSVYSGLRAYNESISPKAIKITMRSEESGIRIWRIK